MLRFYRRKEVLLSLIFRRPSSCKNSFYFANEFRHCFFRQRRLLSSSGAPVTGKLAAHFSRGTDLTIAKYLDADTKWEDKYSKTSTAIAILIRKRIIRILEIVIEVWNKYSG